MCINKDLKSAVIRPSKAYLQKTSLFFNYRIKAFKNIIQQLFPTDLLEHCKLKTIIDNTPHARHCEENIQTMCSLITGNKQFITQDNNRGLLNVFTNQVATPEQAHDMLSFRQIGLQAYQQYITTRILHTSSVINAPLRCHRLLTMSSISKKRKRITPKEQEDKQIIKCLRQHLVWCQQNGKDYDCSNEQYSLLPRAIANEDGHPHKANKSHWTNKLQSRYQSAEPSVFVNSLPWVPQAVIVDAMFIINTTPLRRTTTMTDYTKLLFRQFASEHYKAGTTEVHFIFDKLAEKQFNPKYYEHIRKEQMKKHSKAHELILHATSHKDGGNTLNVEHAKDASLKLLESHFYR